MTPLAPENFTTASRLASWLSWNSRSCFGFGAFQSEIGCYLIEDKNYSVDFCSAQSPEIRNRLI